MTSNQFFGLLLLFSFGFGLTCYLSNYSVYALLAFGIYSIGFLLIVILNDINASAVQGKTISAFYDLMEDIKSELEEIKSNIEDLPK